MSKALNRGIRPVVAITVALWMTALACTSAIGGQGNIEETATPFVVTATPRPDGAEVQQSGEASGNGVQARADREVPIRERSDPNCPQIGVWKTGDLGNLLIRTTSPADYWYETNYLGDDNKGWVYQGQEADNFTLLDPDDSLPRVPEQGCAAAEASSSSCGDGTCNAVETCQTCTADCGVCPVASGACPSGPGNCCGDGICQTDEGPDWCGDCAAPASGAVCGNNLVEDGEECDPPEAEPALPPEGGQVCWCSSTCGMSCKIGGGGAPPPVCGNNLVEDGEECDPPEAEPALPPEGGQVCWCSSTCGMSCKTGGGGAPPSN